MTAMLATTRNPSLQSALGLFPKRTASSLPYWSNWLTRTPIRESKPPRMSWDCSPMLPANLQKKALKRLIRGLCSGRKAARYGFFVAFTELLRQKFPNGAELPDGIKLEEVLPTISQLTQVGASSLGQVSGKPK